MKEPLSPEELNRHFRAVGHFLDNTDSLAMIRGHIEALYVERERQTEANTRLREACKLADKRIELLEEFYAWAQGAIDSLDIYYDSNPPQLIQNTSVVCGAVFLDSAEAASQALEEPK